jgi:hypothetical protein
MAIRALLAEEYGPGATHAYVRALPARQQGPARAGGPSAGRASSGGGQLECARPTGQLTPVPPRPQ